MFPKTYYLGQNYYEDVSHATDQMISYGKKYKNIIKDFSNFINSHNIEKLRTREEYLIELLMIGTLWENYTKNAVKLSKPEANLLNTLYKLRKKNKTLKPYVDKVRGVLNTGFLLKEDYNGITISKNIFSKLIRWLEASHEFNEEVKRLRIWEAYSKEISNVKFNSIIYSSLEFSIYLNKISSNFLKSYLGNTALFLNTQKEKYRFKEDIIFTGRKPNEYYLNMVCAEILNRVYKKKFIKTKKKIVLLPTCMNIGNACKAVKTDKAYKCSECNKSCNISKIVQISKMHDFEIALIPHSSNFSVWLENWRDQEHTGIIGVACLLNLLTGGYEMRRLNIPSQCVLLNFAGCSKHWDGDRATELFVSQLLKIVEQK